MKITKEEWLAFEKSIRWEEAHENAARLAKQLADVWFVPPEGRSVRLRDLAVLVENIAIALRLGERNDPASTERSSTPEVAP